MSTKRGRRKAAPKTPARQQQHLEPDDGLDIQELQNPGSSKPTAPPSPVVTLAKQAITPVVAAAKIAVTMAAAALPAIPETAAIESNALDVDHKPTSSLPGSPPPTALRNPFEAAGDLSTLGPKRGTVMRAPPPNISNSSNMQQQDSLESLADDICIPQRPSATAAAVTAVAAVAVQHFQESFKYVKSHIINHCSSILQILQALVLILLLGMVLRQGTCLHAQQATIAQQQQHMAAQAASLHSLQDELHHAKQELDALPNMNELQESAVSCATRLELLNSTQATLHDTVQSLAMQAQQHEANISDIGKTSQLGEKAWKTLAAATAAADAVGSSSTTAAEGSAAAKAAAAALSLPNVLQQNTHQQAVVQQLQQRLEVLDALPHTIKREVQQQLAAQLPPIDLALADCGARVVFHTPLGSPAHLMAEAAHLMAASSTNAGTSMAALYKLLSVMHWIQQHMSQLLADHVPSIATKQLHGQGQLISPTQIDNMLLRPQAVRTAAVSSNAASSQIKQSCVPLQLKLNKSATSEEAAAAWGADSPAAVIEIALPQVMLIESIVLHHPEPTMTTDIQGADGFSGSWYDAAPSAVVFGLANSSSCSTGVCSAAGYSAVANSSGSKGYREQREAVESESVLADGVAGVQWPVHLSANRFVSAHVVLPVPNAASGGGVAADRVVLHISSSVGGGETVCLHRVSVRGRPTNRETFC